MTEIDFTSEELMTLKEVLENDVERFRREVVRSDHKKFREAVKHKELILEKIVEKLAARSSYGEGGGARNVRQSSGL